MNYLFSLYEAWIMSYTAVLKVALSIYHKKQVVSALIDAERGALNSKPSSPNPPSGGPILLRISPSI